MHEERVGPHVQEDLSVLASPDEEATRINAVVILRDEEIGVLIVDLDRLECAFRPPLIAVMLGSGIDRLLHAVFREDKGVQVLLGRHDDGIKVEPENPKRLRVFVERFDNRRDLLPDGMGTAKIVLRDVDELVDVAVVLAVVLAVLRSQLDNVLDSAVVAFPIGRGEEDDLIWAGTGRIVFDVIGDGEGGIEICKRSLSPCRLADIWLLFGFVLMSGFWLDGDDIEVEGTIGGRRNDGESRGKGCRLRRQAAFVLIGFLRSGNLGRNSYVDWPHPLTPSGRRVDAAVRPEMEQLDGADEAEDERNDDNISTTLPFSTANESEHAEMQHLCRERLLNVRPCQAMYHGENGSHVCVNRHLCLRKVMHGRVRASRTRESQSRRCEGGSEAV